MSETFGERLKKFRKKVGLTQEQLADIISVDHNSISRWEKTTDIPKTQNLQLLAKALGVTEADLLNAPPPQSGGWILDISIKQELKEEVLDLGKPIPQISTIVTARTGAYIALGGDYALWASDAGFKTIIAELKKMRAGVLQQGKANGSIKD